MACRLCAITLLLGPSESGQNETDWVVEWLEREESYMCKYHEAAVGRIVNNGEVSVGLREQTARVAQETYVNLGAAFRGTKCQSCLFFTTVPLLVLTSTSHAFNLNLLNTDYVLSTVPGTLLMET